MLYRSDIVSFFEDRNIIPGRQVFLSYKSYLLLIFDALEKDDVLAHFMSKEAFSITVCGNMKLNFGCWQEAVAAYARFYIVHPDKPRSEIQCDCPMP